MARYKVVGNHAVDGVEPGGTVEIDDDARARYLARAGHVAKPKPPKVDKKEEVTGGDPDAD